MRTLRMGMRRLHVVAFVFSAALVVAIPTSQAATVSVSVTSPREVTFLAKPGERNALDVWHPSLVYTDSGAELTAGPGCVSLGPNSAGCGLSYGNFDAYLGDEDDTARVFLGSFRSRIWAGSGNDSVVGSTFSQYVVAYGEAGDDYLSVAGEGGQFADGGPGDDVVRVFAYGGESTGLGGNGRDLIEFRHVHNTAIHAATLAGGNGPDTIIAQPIHRGTSTADGGPGDDIITISAPLDPRYGIGSFFLLTGGPGDDTLTGGVSIDTVDGGTGDDFIDVRGGDADTVTCGPGFDVVLYDASDTASADCEVTQVE